MIYANPFLKPAPRVRRRIPVKRIPFRDQQVVATAELARQVRATRGRAQANYRMTQGQAIALAEVNRKRVLQGGPLAAFRIPPGLRNRYHPNATDLGDLDLSFKGVFRGIKKVAGKVIGIGLKVGLPVALGYGAVKLAPGAVKAVGTIFKRGTPRVKLPPGLKLPPRSTPSYSDMTPSVSPASEFIPAEVAPNPTPSGSVSFPAVDQASAATADQGATAGAPGWLVPAAIAAGAFVILNGRRRRA